jgi:glucose/arabinose dehydrogenase
MNRLRSVFACILLVACANELAAPTHGSLDIGVSGLPSGVLAAITITGPESFSRSVTASTTISDLVPGSYGITATNVTSDGTTYAPVIGVQTATVTASRTPHIATVAYGTGTGRLAVTITGLSDGVDAAVAVSGPSNFSASLSRTETLAALQEGTYAITASTVISNDQTLTPSPGSQEATVTQSSIATATVSYAANAVALRLQEVVSGLEAPVFLTAPANDPRLFIVEQRGRIRIVKNGALLPDPFLDVTARVNYGGERGLLSLAFDPAYADNGRFYIYYTGSQGDIFVDRHTVSANPDVGNTAFDPVITIQHRQYSNHNGGLVMFGPDGMLYIGTGDGGAGGDPQNNGQNTNSLLGKLLRLDVSSLPYSIPPGNPYANTAGADEIWAYGLRNPWRYSFDGSGARARLYIADVGQNAWEEINYADANTAGLNYGWRSMEGTHCYSPSTGCLSSSLTLPIHEISHSGGVCSITGGFVYRGSAIPELQGHYFYSDYCAGWLRSLRVSGGAAVDHFTWPVATISGITSFGMDAAKELYMLSGNGRVFRIVRE